MTSIPSWIHALDAKVDPPTWRYLSFFEERILRASGARLCVALSGDTHHYARFEPATAAEPTRLTAGGGGAYLSSTHTVHSDLRLRSLDHDADATVDYALQEVYPPADVSSRLSNGILKLGLLNQQFALLLGAVYVVLGLTMLSTLKAIVGTVYVNATASGFDGFLSAGIGGTTLFVVLVLFGGFYAGTDIVAPALEHRENVVRATKLARFGVAALHALGHLAIATIVLWATAKLVGDHTPWIWVVGLLALFVAGAALGSTLFGAVLLMVHRVRGKKARQAANQVFTGQSIPDYKNLLRMRFHADGGLTIYPLGVERACTAWRFAGDDGPKPRFTPTGAPPVAHAIDVPLRYDATGTRVT